MVLAGDNAPGAKFLVMPRNADTNAVLPALPKWSGPPGMAECCTSRATVPCMIMPVSAPRSCCSCNPDIVAWGFIHDASDADEFGLSLSTALPCGAVLCRARHSARCQAAGAVLSSVGVMSNCDCMHFKLWKSHLKVHSSGQSRKDCGTFAAQGALDYHTRQAYWFLSDGWPEFVRELALAAGASITLQRGGQDRSRLE